MEEQFEWPEASAIAQNYKTLGFRVATPDPKPRPRAEMEEQFEWPEASAISQNYQVMVYQFGYVAMFSVAFPIVPLICSLYNLLELRSCPRP
eukprot:152069-Rhodomonas_salina.1